MAKRLDDNDRPQLTEAMQRSHAAFELGFTEWQQHMERSRDTRRAEKEEKVALLKSILRRMEEARVACHYDLLEPLYRDLDEFMTKNNLLQ
jgi:hypothetical protein